MQFLCHWNPVAAFGGRPVSRLFEWAHAACAFCEFVALAYPGPEPVYFD